MDKVRFGRALGYGARHTAKALFRAVDAARAPGTAEASPSAGSAPGAPPAAQPAAGRPNTAKVARVSTNAARNATALGKSVWTPVARFSGVLWLQVTGSVYAVIALAMGQAAWLRRAELRQSIHSPGAQRAWLLVAIFALFAYFAVSAFVRAARREKL